MTIKRSHTEIVDFNDDEFRDDENISYCKHCWKYGFKVPLRNRIYPNEPVPADHENWRQCHECGLIVPVYELEKESKIKDAVDTIESPFELGTTFLGVDRRTSSGGKKARKKRERQQELDEIKEADLRAELAKGHTLISYSEQMPQ